ncbi:A-kinase anchor protein 1, mitochondrial-like [Myxocyprinus asiaticus]|uniref:A-kinase anchor protein 1, mitochondrial-like n=1 Tax=Myxocyprinus asiaticus TaxID=70543 RepID=UPI002221C03C|nr:A-kinase anchor protein 1, mitochondrial-like [Myxocyprinus asiaticus]
MCIVLYFLQLLLPQDVFVEVIVSRVEAGHHLFILQHKHPSYQALPTLTQHMQLCYSQPGCPSLPTPLEVGVVCAAPVAGCGWQRAQVIQYHTEFGTAQIRYVDNGGYDTVNSATLRQIRSDFVTLPFQAAEVLLDNITPLPGEVEFSLEARVALEELTANVALILKVTGSQDGLPLVHIWKQTGDEVVLLNSLLAERELCSWFDTP